MYVGMALLRSVHEASYSTHSQSTSATWNLVNCGLQLRFDTAARFFRWRYEVEYLIRAYGRVRSRGQAPQSCKPLHCIVLRQQLKQQCYDATILRIQ